MSYYDLTTFAAVNSWLIGGASADEAVISSAITGYSAYILTRTGRSYLGGFRTYVERYDGNGSDLLMLRNYPVLSASAVVVNGQAIPQTPDYIQPGYGIDQSGSQAAIVMVGQGGGGQYNTAGQSPWSEGGNYVGRRGGYRFYEGRQNVAVTYVAGTLLDAYAEAQTVPAEAPYTVTATNAASWFADLGATLSSNGSTPAYTVANGAYTFTEAVAGQAVSLNYQYGGVPVDLAQAVTEIIATNYKRRSWMDQGSQIQPGVGTTSFRSWEMSPQNQAIIARYERKFLA